MYPMRTRGDIGYGTREKLELALLGVELIERVVWLALSVGLAVVAAICALRGSPWPLPAGSGLVAVGFRVLLQRRAGERDRGEGQ